MQLAQYMTTWIQHTSALADVVWLTFLLLRYQAAALSGTPDFHAEERRSGVPNVAFLGTRT